jgi:hypothetical protein
MAPDVPVRTVPPYIRFGSDDTSYGVTPDVEKANIVLPQHQSRWTDFMPATGGPPQRTLSPAEIARSKAIREAYHNKEKYGTDDWATTEKPTKQSRRPWWYQLVFRFFIWFNSVIALGLGAGIFQQPHKQQCHRGGSTYLAIVVDAVAIPYTAYIAYDEFFSKPIGLRKPSSKLRLLLLDLFFIVFEGSNVALAFESLSDDNLACSAKSECARKKTCDMQKGMVAVLMVALVAWLLTFVMSLTRLMNIAWDRK